MSTQSAGPVSRISVDKLFGRYTYICDAPLDSSLLILYGDNGSGKTTILRLLFHLLSAARNRAHRTWIGNVPFRRYRVDFCNGRAIEAERKAAGSGTYQYNIYDGSECINSTPIQLDADNDIADKAKTGADLEILLPLIDDCVQADIYIVGDERTIESDRIPKRKPDRGPFVWSSSRALQTWSEGEIWAGQENDKRSSDLYRAVGQAENWARSQAYGANTTGTASASSIYVDVIKQIASAPVNTDIAEEHSTDLLTKIAELEALEEEYQPFGLSSGFVGDELRYHLMRADDDAHGVISEILRPYLESIEARFGAVASLKSRMSTFVHWMDHLLKDKHVQFNLRSGIVVYTDDGDTLAPETLSSGEQHLLLLLSSVLYAQERQSIFVIDEPELSLNIKWQQQLLDILMNCTEGGSTQFVLATHSFEILSGHGACVVPLSNILATGIESGNLQ